MTDRCLTAACLLVGEQDAGSGHFFDFFDFKGDDFGVHCVLLLVVDSLIVIVFAMR
jgi:hypothetical protein